MNSTEDGIPVPRRYLAIMTLMTGVALSCLDTALVNVALPTIARESDQIGPVSCQWPAMQ